MTAAPRTPPPPAPGCPGTPARDECLDDAAQVLRDTWDEYWQQARQDAARPAAA